MLYGHKLIYLFLCAYFQFYVRTFKHLYFRAVSVPKSPFLGLTVAHLLYIPMSKCVAERERELSRSRPPSVLRSIWKVVLFTVVIRTVCKEAISISSGRDTPTCTTTGDITGTVVRSSYPGKEEPLWVIASNNIKVELLSSHITQITFRIIRIKCACTQQLYLSVKSKIFSRWFQILAVQAMAIAHFPQRGPFVKSQVFCLSQKYIINYSCYIVIYHERQ